MPKVKYFTDEERNAAVKASQKKWRDANKDKLADIHTKYRKDRLAKYAEYQRNWRINNPERCSEIDKASYANTRQHNRQSRMLSAAKQRAARHELPFDITHEDIVIPEYCPVLPWIKLERGSNDTRPELDRVVPHLGYVKGNVQVISGRANRIKWNASLDELKRIADYVEGKPLK